MKTIRTYLKYTPRLLLLFLFLINTTFAVDAEREQWLARAQKNRTVAEAKCGTDAQITVQLNRGGSVTGVCLFLSVGYITMRIAEKAYSFALNGDIAEISETAAAAHDAVKITANDEQLRRFEVKRLESWHAIGVRFIDLNLLEDPFKFGKIAINYEIRFESLGLFVEGGADFKAGVAQNSKKYDGMAQIRWLFSRAFDTAYIGVFYNYQTGTTVQKDADSQKRDVEIRSYSLGALFGKKWVFGSGLFLDLTMRAGPYFETILSSPPNFKYEAADDAIGKVFRSGLGGLAVTLSMGYVF